MVRFSCLSHTPRQAFSSSRNRRSSDWNGSEPYICRVSRPLRLFCPMSGGFDLAKVKQLVADAKKARAHGPQRGAERPAPGGSARSRAQSFPTARTLALEDARQSAAVGLRARLGRPQLQGTRLVSNAACGRAVCSRRRFPVRRPERRLLGFARRLLEAAQGARRSPTGVACASSLRATPTSATLILRSPRRSGRTFTLCRSPWARTFRC